MCRKNKRATGEWERTNNVFSREATKRSSLNPQLETVCARVRSIPSEGGSLSSKICRSPSGYLEKVFKNQKERWMLQKMHHLWGSKHTKPTYWPGDCLCRRQWRQRFMWDQILLRSWQSTRTRTSKSFRICSTSPRRRDSECEHDWMCVSFVDEILAGSWSGNQVVKRQKYEFIQIQSYAWEKWWILQMHIEDEKVKWKNFNKLILTENYVELMENRLSSSGIFPRTYAIGNQSSENSRKTWKSKALNPKILKSNHLHVDVQRYWLGEKRKIWTMYFNSNSEQVKNYAKNQSGIRDVRGSTTHDQIGTRRLVQDPEPAVEKKPQFEIDLRVKRSISRCYLTRWRKDERDQWTVGKVSKRDQAQHPFVTICRRVKWSWVKNQVALLSWSWSNWDELRRLFSVFLAWSTYQRDWSCVNAASGFDPTKVRWTESEQHLQQYVSSQKSQQIEDTRANVFPAGCPNIPFSVPYYSNFMTTTDSLLTHFRALAEF